METLSSQKDVPVSPLPQATRPLVIPSGYSLKSIVPRSHNGRRINVYRYEKANGENGGLGGEHYSFSVDAVGGELLGLMWMDARFASGELLSEEAAADAAIHFLSRMAGDLLPELEVLWIREHKETIAADGRKVRIPGMKYKAYRRSRGDYAWVIVGSGGDVITFERDILWRGVRLTEKWLHDEYCAKHDKGPRR